MLDRFLEARRADDLVVLEGFEALENAMRFAEDVLDVAAGDPEAIAARLEPALANRFTTLVTKEGLPSDDVLVVAKRPPFEPHPGVAIHLAKATPTDLGRAIRVAAAAGVATVYTDQDPWTEEAVKASHGLHFALAVGLADGTFPALAFSPRTKVATRAGTTLDLPSALAAALYGALNGKV
ncbi:hypothetical protein [Solirubrobacter soli]|uniref:hypothetical protein n=1 Tax=Solirubrobacter soli TaxID=363832 RepID=UPI0004037116|nr:hypothetical protein [Solirubrobacter soli]